MSLFLSFIRSLVETVHQSDWMCCLDAQCEVWGPNSGVKEDSGERFQRKTPLPQDLFITFAYPTMLPFSCPDHKDAVLWTFVIGRLLSTVVFRIVSISMCVPLFYFYRFSLCLLHLDGVSMWFPLQCFQLSHGCAFFVELSSIWE